MKFMISPSKTLTMTLDDSLRQTDPLFPEQTHTLYQELKQYSREELKSIMKIKGTLLDDVYETYQHYPNTQTGQALLSYTGMVFKQLDVPSLSNEHRDYLMDHLRILDAMYGILRPTDLIKPYRLDFKMKLNNNLYSYWNLEPILEDETLINLASKEYAKLLPKKADVTISFKEHKKGKYRTIGTYAKMARGMFLRFCALNKVMHVEELKTFNEAGYHYNASLSKADHFVFTRTTK